MSTPGTSDPVDTGSLDTAQTAIAAAIATAEDLGIRHRAYEPGSPEPDEEDLPALGGTLVFDLSGLDSAVKAGEVEKALSELPDTTARVVFGAESLAYVTAPPHVHAAQIIELLAQHGVSAEKRVGSLLRVLGEQEKPLTRKRRRRRRRPNEVLEKAKHWRARRPDNMEVLFTARELITRTRLIVAVLFSVPVVAMALIPEFQFSYWQWVSLGLATPVVSYSAWPFHRAALGGLRRGMAALDSATSLAVALAYLWSWAVVLIQAPGGEYVSRPHWLMFLHEPQIFLDVACSATTLVLFARLLSRRSRVRGMRLISSHTVDPNAAITVIRRVGGESVRLEVQVSELHIGEYVLVGPGEVIPVDGIVVGGSSLISPGPVSGHRDRAVVKVNDRIFAGGRNMGDTLKIRVEKAGHATRLACMHRWVDACEEAEHRSTRAATRSASVLVPWTIVLSFITFLIWFLLTEDPSGAIGVALAVLTIVGPVSLAISTTLASRLGLAMATSQGILFRDEQALWDLADCDVVIFNRVGTLTTGNMKVESITASEGENPDLILRVAGALAMESEHSVSQALVRAAREARDRGTGGDSVPHWINVSGEHVTENGSFVATVEIPINGEMTAVKAALWRPRDLSELEDEKLALAAVSGGTPLAVSWKNKTRGVINVLDATRDDAPEAIEELEDEGVTTMMLSRDTYPVARKAADTLGISGVLAGVSPSRKSAAVRSVHRQGHKVALVGDTDLMKCLSVADSGILFGAADQLDKAQASVVVLRNDVRAIPDALAIAGKVRAIGSGNLRLSWVYNLTMLGFCVVGLINPLLSTLLMWLCTAVIEARTMSLRGRRIPIRRQSVWDIRRHGGVSAQ